MAKCMDCLYHLGGYETCHCVCNRDNPHWKNCRENMDLECLMFLSKRFGSSKEE